MDPYERLAASAEEAQRIIDRVAASEGVASAAWHGDPTPEQARDLADLLGVMAEKV